ncbi:dephospho-CoA kinase [Candidatus Omnitrophota bacterium]
MIIGITGSFGSGKTTAREMFRGLGAYVIDADKVCHGLMAPSKKVFGKIVRHFGKGILKGNKTIDRKKLAQIVFKEKTKLELLNKLVHPEAIREIERIVRTKKDKKLIVIDAALMVESGFYRKMDRLVLVRTNLDKAIKRLIRAKGSTQSEILQRIRMQAPLKKKRTFADFIIDNNGSRKQTKIQIEKIWKQLGVGYACKSKTGY